MSVQTMATRITSQNLPLVQACLPAGFVNIPPDKSLGCYLVINEIKPVLDRQGEPNGTFARANSWYSEDLFFEAYRPMQEPDSIGFFPVEIAISQ